MATLTTLFNPLDEFATYSVHYVMLACRTTENAQVFTTQPDTEEGKRINVATLAAIEQVKRLGDAVPYGDNKDTAFLIMDTRRFSQFSIDKLKYDATINGLQKTGTQGNLLSNVEMTIIDAAGISFINFITWLMDYKMQCNFDGMIYMLRVIFTGHDHAGKTKTIQAVTIPMHLIKLELNLDFAKGAYNAEFMPNTNFDARRHSRWLNIYSASTYFSGNGNLSLGALVNKFQAELNKRSEDFFNEATAVLKDFHGEKPEGKYGRRVEYQITLPTEWEPYTFQGVGVGGASESIVQKILQDKEKPKPDPNKPTTTGGKATDATVAAIPGMNITDVLHLMLKQVPQINDLGNSRFAGPITFYNFLVGITSDDSTVIVHVDVLPFVIPDVILKAQKGDDSIAQDDDKFYKKLTNEKGAETGERIPREYFEFDYIFTGKNKDILHFDLKFQDLTWLLASNLTVGAGAMQRRMEATGQKDSKIKVNPSAELVTARAFDPILLPRDTADALRNFNLYSSIALNGPEGDEIRKGRQDYLRNLSNFYANSPITIVITIRGNPDIMAKFTNTRILPHATTAVGTNGSQVGANNQSDYRKLLTDRIIKDNTNRNGVEQIGFENGKYIIRATSERHYASTPVFVRININGPNVDDRTGAHANELTSDANFTREILHNNFYVVMKVTNTIERGNFTQDIEMYSHNIFGRGKRAPGPPSTEIIKK